MKITYYAIIYKHPRDKELYSVEFPEIPYAATQGTDIENAMFMAQDYLKTRFEYPTTEKLPPNQSPEKILADFKADPKNAYEKLDMVGILPITAYIKEKTKRLNITLPQSVIDSLDNKIGKGKKASFIAQCVSDRLRSM